MLEPLARLGYASKAFIYAIVGLLAIAAALNRGGRVTDTHGALRVVLAHPAGNFVLIVLAAGLCGYALWRLLDAFFDPDGHGTSFGGLVERIGNAVRALIYGGLGIEAFRLAQGLRSSPNADGTVRVWTARLLGLPLGELIVAAIGLTVALYGVSEVVAAVKDTSGKKMDLSRVSSSSRRTLRNISRVGVAARALIIVVLGVFLVRAAFSSDAGEAHGVRESILELARAVQGRWALAAIACGLLAYAVDQALHARYRQIRAPVRL